MHRLRPERRGGARQHLQPCSRRTVLHGRKEKDEVCVVGMENRGAVSIKRAAQAIRRVRAGLGALAEPDLQVQKLRMTAEMLDLENILQALAAERRIFHSEADFQHALAWKIHELHPDAKIRLEVPSGRFDKRERIDIVANVGGRKYALELKYKKRKLSLIVDDEEFSLRADGAQDISRYDFIKDVVRLERYVSSLAGTTGYAILLTNDELYWKESARGVTSAAFFLHEGRTLNSNGPLTWYERTGSGTKKNREDSLSLLANYQIRWRDYSTIPELQSCKFRYILLTVTSARAAG